MAEFSLALTQQLPSLTSCMHVFPIFPGLSGGLTMVKLEKVCVLVKNWHFFIFLKIIIN
jgi:hypothetical protein